jgi:hypothetical protein
MPALYSSDNSVAIGVRLTRADEARLRTQCASAGMKKSSYIRTLIEQDLARQPQERIEEYQED